MSTQNKIINSFDSKGLKIIASHPNNLYKLYESSYLIEQQHEFIRECNLAHRKFISQFPETNSTASTTIAEFRKYRYHEGYLLYNIFSMTAPNIYLYKLFCDLISAIKDFTNDKNLYMQAWLNFQEMDEVLGWHSHKDYKYHGYISIDPQFTNTEFESFIIENKVGQIYIGESSLRHRVINKARYDSKRITIGFDLIEPQNIKITNKGFIPLVL